MENKEYIAIQTICRYYKVSDEFILSLCDYDLLEVEVIDSSNYIPKSQVVTLEKYLRLHNDLKINSEGIGAIHHLMQRLENMQDEIAYLRKRLGLYENE